MIEIDLDETYFIEKQTVVFTDGWTPVRQDGTWEFKEMREQLYAQMRGWA